MHPSGGRPIPPTRHWASPAGELQEHPRLRRWAGPRRIKNKRTATIVLKPRVRESRPVHDIVLITKHLRASNASMLERRVRGVRLENLPAISLSK